MGAGCAKQPAAVEQGNTGPENKVRLLLDGANGVRVNSRIRVRDQDRTRAASDIKRILRAAAQRAPVAWVPGSCFGTLAVTDKRAVWLDAWCAQLLVESVMQARRFHKGAGTAAFVFGSFAYDTSCSGPSQLSVSARRSQVSTLDNSIWKEAGGLMQRQGTRSKNWRWWSRPDDQGKIVKRLFVRFAEQLTSQDSPWGLRQDGENFSLIATPEAMGLLLALRAFGPSLQGGAPKCSPEISRTGIW